MKNKWYRSRGIKSLLIVIMHIALVLIVIGTIFFGNYFHGDVESMIKVTSYTETKSFSNEVYMESLEIIQGLAGKENLEKNGKLDTDKIVDLVDFVDNGQISGKNESGLAYRLGDIQKMEQNYSNRGYNEHNSGIVVCKKGDGSYDYYYYDQFYTMVQDGKIKFVIDSSYESAQDVTNAILGDLSYGAYTEGNENRSIVDNKGNILYMDFWSYTGQTYGVSLTEETYHPVDTSGVLELVNENKEWNGKLSLALEYISRALDIMPNYISQYYVYDRYTEGNTNLTYMYVNEVEKKIYSNNSNYSKYKQVKTYEDKIKSLGSYIVVRPKLSESETNMNTDLQNWPHLLASLPGEDEGDSYLILGVDDSFPVSDTLSQLKTEYDKYYRWLFPILGIVTISIILFLISLVWLTVVAGRHPGDEELHLHPFDRWFTEVGAATVFGIWIIPLSVCLSVGGSVSFYMVAGGIMAVVTCALFLWGYLSLVRRIKGKLLWKGSLLRWLIKHWKQYFGQARAVCLKYTRNWNSTWKITVLFISFVVVHFILTIMFAVGGYPIILVIGAMDIAVWLWLLRRAMGRQILISGSRRIGEGDLEYKIPTDQLQGEQRSIAEYINRMGEGLDAAVENSLKNEKMKTELITNVSHDIKTPLTSIINYVDLLKRENFTDPKILGYLDVLENKAQRLKVLTEDVVEASKVSTGNITLNMTTLNFTEMINQVTGEFAERFEKNNLSVVANSPEESIVIKADGRRMYRVLENIFNNAAKYAMGGTRIYVDLVANKGRAVFNMKNISAQPLNISADELTERFIRGDISRSTEGSGLGLSIAKSLTELQGGTFNLYLDGDLFKVMIEFPLGLD